MNPELFSIAVLIGPSSFFTEGKHFSLLMIVPDRQTLECEITLRLGHKPNDKLTRPILLILIMKGAGAFISPMDLQFSGKKTQPALSLAFL